MKILQNNRILSKFRTNTLTRYLRYSFCSATESKEKQEFKKFVDFLLERSNYNWDDHHLQAMNTLKDLKSIKSYVRGDEQKAKEILKNEKINLFVSALLDSEKNLEKLSKNILDEIEDITGLNESDFTSIINHYNYYKGLHSYLYGKKMKNEYLPNDQNELQQLMLFERPQFLVDLNKERMEKKREEKTKKMSYKENKKLREKEQKQHLGRIKTWQI